MEVFCQQEVIFCCNKLKAWVILSNMGDICKICKKACWLFATHCFTNFDLGYAYPRYALNGPGYAGNTLSIHGPAHALGKREANAGN